ncbi:MAG: thrombospondin type 3 repeat-containing protein [Deltaproteobacteria bacterium]|nr:thrombospondin type 3 repeat-containing protein [Deltaproteobacteria bacterium]
MAPSPTPSATPLPDRDADGIADSQDNCPDVANADQLDSDGDGLGDVCDPAPTITLKAAALDFDGDRVGDLATVRRESGGFIFEWTSSQSSLRTEIEVGAARGSVVAADLDGNGKNDLIHLTKGPRGSYVWRVFADSLPGTARSITFGSNDGQAIVGCNLMGDDGADLAIVEGSTLVVRTLASGRAARSRLSLLPGGKLFGCADVDGNGIDELLISLSVSRVQRVRGFAVGEYLVAVNRSGSRIATFRVAKIREAFGLDVDGDGRDEVGVVQRGANRSNIVSLFRRGALVPFQTFPAPPYRVLTPFGASDGALNNEQFLWSLAGGVTSIFTLSPADGSSTPFAEDARPVTLMRDVNIVR